MKIALLITWTLALVATVSISVAWYYHRGCYGRALEATATLSECHELASRIVKVRAAPQKASLAGQSLTALTEKIEQAAVQATISTSDIVRIDPQAVRRIADSPYKEQATELELQAVSLEQVAHFIRNVNKQDRDLHIDTLRLRVPYNEGNEAEITRNSEKWLAEVVLTQRIYAPKSTARKSR